MSSVQMITKTVIIAAVLQTHGRSCLGCRGDEITWRSDKPGQKSTCIPCIDCPDGMEPSIPCGGTAMYGTHLHCVACKQGTFSDNYGKGPCRPCSLCSIGRTVRRNCSATTNTQCGSCKFGYYQKVVIINMVYHCLPCSVCCEDGKDQLEKQCKDQGLPRQRLCKPRAAPSCQLVWTAPKTTWSTPFLGANHTAKEGASRKRQAEEATLAPLRRTPEPFARTTATTTSATFSSHETLPTFQYQTNSASEGSHGNKSKGSFSIRSDDSNTQTAIIVSTMCGISTIFILIILIVFTRNKLAHFFERMKCGPILKCGDAKLGKQTERTPLDDIKQSINAVPLGVLISLKDLKSLSFDTYTKVWKRLDKQAEGMSKGDFRDVALRFMYLEEDVWELEKEFRSSGSGSPSRQLLEGLETRRPDLTVLEFIKVLLEPNILRNDVVEILKDYLHR